MGKGRREKDRIGNIRWKYIRDKIEGVREDRVGE